MYSGREFVVWIAAEFDWKPLESKALDQTVTINANKPSSKPKFKGPHQILAQFDPSLTLTKRRVPLLEGPNNDRQINKYWLRDAAFMPKKYTVRLEKDTFLTPDVANDPKGFMTVRMYTLRLVFDSSPFPPPEQWKDPFSYEA